MRSKHACQGGLTNDMLDDNFHCSEGHVATRDAVGSTSAPFIRGHSLQEMLNCRKQLHWVKFQIRQILRNIPGQFPYALQNEFRYLGFRGVREGAVRWKWSDDLEEKSEQGARLQLDLFKSYDIFGYNPPENGDPAPRREHP
jgi:hypothetical protein